MVYRVGTIHSTDIVVIKKKLLNEKQIIRDKILNEGLHICQCMQSYNNDKLIHYWSHRRLKELTSDII